MMSKFIKEQYTEMKYFQPATFSYHRRSTTMANFLLTYAEYKRVEVHGIYGWVALLVALLPWVGYLIYPPFSRLYGAGETPPSIHADMARSLPFIVGMMLSPATLMASGILAFAYGSRQPTRYACLAAFLLALPMAMWFLWMITH